jgi:tetratricopeptide (TPR) repeat protein
MYRLGRAYDELKQDAEAIQYYNRTIRSGENSSTYFAARAALQAGYIFEKNGQKAKALEYFNKVLDMDDHEFKNSLEQRAKAGINRLKGG